MAVCIVIRSIDCFRTFDQVWVITGGGPARQTEVFSIYAYTEAFVFLNFGRGTAAAMIGAVIIGVLGWGLYKLLNRFMEVSRGRVLPSPMRRPAGAASWTRWRP